MPYYTFAEDLAASAAYWILCTGDTVYANKQSLVGSIGVITMHGATKGWFDKKKLDRTHITSGEQLDDYKYDSTRFTEITDETRNDIQERLEKMGKMFQDHVKKHRADKLD